MADTGKLEEGNAHGEKRKFDQPNSVDETFEQKAEVKDDESDSSKRQKLETPSENETEVIHSFLIGGKMEETNDGGKDPNNAEGNDKVEHLSVEPEIVERRRYTAEEKGKGVLIEESDDEDDSDEDESSSDDSDSDFSNGLDSESEDIPF